MKKTFKGPSRLHLALNIRQLDPSVKFYEALFNLKASKVKPGYAKFEVADPPVNLTLNETDQVTGNRVSHLGVEVKTGKDVRRQAERLKQLGLETEIEESTTCCYARQDKVWVTDPDGNSWETFVVYEDSDLKTDSPRLHPEKDCCSA